LLTISLDEREEQGGKMTRKPFWIVLCVLALFGLACGLTARPGGGSPSGDIDGQRMFKNFGCTGCHGDSNQGPLLAGIYGKEERLENGETVTVDEDYLRESILDPGAKIVQGYQPIMPSYDGQLDDEEVDALVNYIRSLD
jgi:cytochrome c oxidase subunit II